MQSDLPANGIKRIGVCGGSGLYKMDGVTDVRFVSTALVHLNFS